MYLSHGNEKYAQLKMRAFTFGIPAGRSASGLRTCPGAKACQAGCYAQQGRYFMTNVRRKQEQRLKLTQSPEFVPTIVDEVKHLRAELVRIHDAGDFYRWSYLQDWIRIVGQCSTTEFLAYTKMIPFVLKAKPPKNLHLICSYGGRWDRLIDPRRHQHTRIFSSVEDLEAAGYVDCHVTDLPALDPKNIKLGLVYHGFPTRRFTTGPK